MRRIVGLRGIGLAAALFLIAASPADAALSFRFDRGSARAGTYAVAFQQGWSGAVTGVIVYLVPTKLPGVTPDGAGSYVLPRPPAHDAVRLGRPRLTRSHRLSIRFRVPRVRTGDYTTAFWCSSCSRHGDFFASALWGASWTGAAGGVLRIIR
jgi:hypothetical protein